jgi:hypothetical protein
VYVQVCVKEREEGGRERETERERERERREKGNRIIALIRVFYVLVTDTQVIITPIPTGVCGVQPERVVAVDNDSKKVYVKWQGLEYKDNTWEEASTVAPGLIKALRKRQACDISAPTGNGVRFHLPLKDAPALFRPIGTLKDYQIEGTPSGSSKRLR